MSMLNWFKSLFTKKVECNCKYCCNMHDHITTKRRGYDIVMPISTYNSLLKDGMSISICFTKDKKPSSVQLSKNIDGKQTYAGTLKTYMGVKSFKDGNPCNFHKNNIIVKE